VQAVWTILAAELDGEPLWLVGADSKSGRENVLAWRYDQKEKSLFVFPFDWISGSNLILTVQIHLLNPSQIAAGSTQVLNLKIESASGVFLGSPGGQGNVLAFRK
jgi:hypothetical protein